MSFWSRLGQLFGAGAPSGRTPPYQQPQGTAQGQAQQQPPWYSYAIPAAAGAASTILQGRAQNQQNQRLQDRTAMLDKLAADEQARREYYTSMLMPNILRGMGQKNPALWAMAKQRLQGLPGYGQGQQAPQTPTKDTGWLSSGTGQGDNPTSTGGGDAAWARVTGSPYIDPNDPEAWRRT